MQTTKTVPGILPPNGAACAAIVAGAAGTLAFGLTVVLATASSQISTQLNWSAPVGPLSGKAGVAVAVWLVSWFVLHTIWHKTDRQFAPVWMTSLALIAVGMALTFPPIFELFASH